jgi:plasmid maintenance system antidote protein VapI
MAVKTHSQLLDIFKKKVTELHNEDGTGGGEAMAKKLDVSPSYISLLLAGKRDISPHIARKLGYQWHGCKATFTRIKR